MSVTILQPGILMEDPHNCTDAADALTVLEAAYDPLMRRGPDGRFAPALATPWEVAPDCRRWTFHLREGVRFPDGSPLDADAVIAILRRVARPDMGVTLGAPGVWAQYQAGAQFTVQNPLTVEVTLEEPMADLPNLLVQGFVAAPACLDDPVANPCGTGAYVIETVTAGSITAHANPHHWAGAPPNDRIVVFTDGKAHVAIRLPPEGPPGPDRLDRPALVRDVLGGAGRPLYGAFSPAHRSYVLCRPIRTPTRGTTPSSRPVTQLW